FLKILGLIRGLSKKRKGWPNIRALARLAGVARLSLVNIGITVYPTYGGSGIVGSELGRDLADRGHNVHFISSFLPTRLTELSERIHFHEVEMMSYPLFDHQPYDLALATKMATVARAEKL